MASSPCTQCHKPGAKARCSGCRTALYCGAACAKKDWPRHKAECKELALSSSSSSSSLSFKRMALAGAVAAGVVAVALAAARTRTTSPQVGGPLTYDPTYNRPVMPPPAPRMTVQEILARSKTLPCKDKKKPEFCADMASKGACDEAPGWMSVMCTASCGRCELLNPKVRCDPKNMGIQGQDAVGPGDLRRLFDNLPSKGYKVDYLHRDPPLVLIHDFVTDEEISHLLGNTESNLKRSTDQGSFDEHGVQEQVVSSGRTSSNAWCMNECEQDPVIQNLIRRISEYVEIPAVNFESFQVLRYRKGEKYDVHHDASETDAHMPSGFRILTFFIYLSDVKEGGETNFPELAVSVKPKRGSVALWPSVDVNDPTKIDWHFRHAALPVINGTKRAANTWIHMRDYKTPNIWGCTGSFDD